MSRPGFRQPACDVTPGIRAGAVSAGNRAARSAGRRRVLGVVLAVRTGIRGCARTLLGNTRALRITVSAFLCLLGVDLLAQSSGAQPYQVEAVFLFNFTQFVSWPAGAFADAHAPIVICVLGEDPFGSYLDDTLRGERVEERPLIARRYGRPEELGPCHILYVGADQAPHFDAVLAAVRGKPVLTVGSFDNFGRSGGMVRFIVENRRVRLRVNVDAARAQNLSISAKLLRIAEIVTSQEP